MFLAIVNDTYSEVKTEKFALPNLKDWFLEKFQILIGCFWCVKKNSVVKKEDEVIEEIVESTNKNDENQEFKKVFDEIRQKYDFESEKLKSKVVILEKSVEGIIKRMDRLITIIEITRRTGNQ